MMDLSDRMEKIRAINPEYFDFLVQWQGLVLYFVFGSIFVGIFIYTLYKIKTATLKTPKEKFDHITKYEIRRLFLMHVFFAIALFFFINHLEWETIARDVVWFIIRFAVAIAIGFLYGYVAYLLLKFYWPKRVYKRLKRLRYTPRINPKSGNKMKLLSEEEEDVYLDEGMQAEEEVFSVDYDVWIDQETGDTHIEKYDGRLTAEECDRCGFQTLKLVKEEIVKESNEFEDGELQKEFKCVYCNRVKRRTVKISKTLEKDYSKGRLVDDPLAEDERILLVKVDIKSSAYNLLSYEFRNLKEALKSEAFSGEGYGIEEIKVDIFTNENEHQKFTFDNLEEARSFIKQFDVHNIRE